MSSPVPAPSRPPAPTAPARAGVEPGAVLTTGFGITVAMWLTGYATHLPFVADGLGEASGVLSLVGFLLCLLAGGLLAGRHAPRGVLTGALSGALAALLDLLILGSLLREEHTGPSAAVWVPGFFLACIALAALGAWIGRATRDEPPGQVNWNAHLVAVTGAATLLLLMAGGLVTSNDAGLAVPDWPNTYSSNMFLYPLSRMTGGVFYEHTHRLFGALVGLTTIAMGLRLWWTEERRWLGRLALVAIPLVVFQGILGGLRVTGRFTTATEGLDPRIELAVVHGVLAQVFFALLWALVACASTPWRRAGATPHRHAAADRTLSGWLVGLVLGQLVLGALVRHLNMAVTWHITLAVVVITVGVAAGVRSWGLYADRPVLPRVGLVLAVAVGVQLLLGVGSLVTTRMAVDGGHPFEVLFTTAHQTLGAIILVLAVQLRLWQQRLLEPVPEEEGAAPLEDPVANAPSGQNTA